MADPVFSIGGVDQYQGDARAVLAELPAESCHTCVCSPPYWQLRAYQTDPQVWGGDPACEHSFAKVFTPNANTGGGVTFKQASNPGSFSSEGYELDEERRRTEGGSLPHKLPGPRGYTTETCSACGAMRCELGLEPEIDQYIDHLVDVFASVRRVLHATGTLFVNIGDTFAGSGKGRNRSGEHADSHGDKQGTNKGTLEGRIIPGARSQRPGGLPAGSLCMIPSRFALAMQDDGWLLRSAIVLWKPGPMPQSMQGVRWERCRVQVGNSQRAQNQFQQEAHFGSPQGAGVASRAQRTAYDQEGNGKAKYEDCPGCSKCQPNGGLVLRWGSGRPTSAYEMLYAFAKSERYFWNSEAVRLPHKPESLERYRYGLKASVDPNAINGSLHDRFRAGAGNCERLADYINPAGANARDVLRWEPSPSTDAHYAQFPQFIPRFAIQAGTADQVCSVCLMPYAPVVDATPGVYRPSGRAQEVVYAQDGEQKQTNTYGTQEIAPQRLVQGHRPTCTCKAPPQPARVLDCFGGSGTTGIAAAILGRSATLIDLLPDYVEIARKRLIGAIEGKDRLDPGQATLFGEPAGDPKGEVTLF